MEHVTDPSPTEPPTEPIGALTLRVGTMPADANAAGDIFGGWVLSQMDIAGGIAGAQRACGRVATVAIDAMQFIHPIDIGDTVSIYTRVGKIGRTSIKIHLEAWAGRAATDKFVKVTDGTFTFVALDEKGAPTPVPPIKAAQATKTDQAAPPAKATPL